MKTRNSALDRSLDLCTYCPRLCHFACPVAHGDGSETSTAWGMMTLANLIRRGDLPPTAENVEPLFRCVSCGRCTDFCRHGNDVAESLAQVRATPEVQAAVPAPVREMERNYRHFGAPFEPSKDTQRYAASSVVNARIGWFPSCGMMAEEPATIEGIRQLLETASGEPVALAWGHDAWCCGGRAHRAGLSAEAARAAERNATVARLFEVVITDCPDGLNNAGNPQGTEAISLTDFLLDHVGSLPIQDADSPEGLGSRGEITLHGGCRERRVGNSRAAERALLECLGWTVLDAWAIDGHQECCAADPIYAGLTEEGALRAARALVQGARTIDTRLATSASRCARHMSRASGEPVASLLDLVLEACRAEPPVQ